jgi:CBS domain-containing membrane protein
VREIMSTPVTTLEPTDNLAFAEELMNVERVRHLPVVDGDVLVGLLSNRDVLAASISVLNNPAEEEDLERKRKVQVRELMRGSVETIGPDEDAVKAADVLLTQKVGSLPVVDEHYRLLGIVTEADFVALARNALATGKLAPRLPIPTASTRQAPAKAPAKVATKKAAAAAKKVPAKRAAPTATKATRGTTKASPARAQVTRKQARGGGGGRRTGR